MVTTLFRAGCFYSPPTPTFYLSVVLAEDLAVCRPVWPEIWNYSVTAPHILGLQTRCTLSSVCLNASDLQLANSTGLKLLTIEGQLCPCLLSIKS